MVPSDPPPKYPALGTVGNVKFDAKAEFLAPPKDAEEVAANAYLSILNGPLTDAVTVSLE